MSEADFFVDVDIPGLQPVPDSNVALGIEPVKGNGAAPDDTKALLEQVTRDRDAWKSRAEGGATTSKAEIAAERTAREAAETRAGVAAEGELRAKWNEAARTHEQLASGVIQMKEILESGKRELANAIADENLTPQQRGKFVADAQGKIALAASDLRTLEQGQAGAADAIEHLKRVIQADRAKAAEPKPEVKAEPAAAPVDTPDQWIARFPKKTQDWLNTHKDYVLNMALNKKLVTFSEDYHDGGVRALHDDNFIAALNKRFGFAEDDVAKEDLPVLEVDTSPSASTRAAAPPSRNNTPTTRQSNTVSATGRVRLSGDERNTALAMFPDMDTNEAIKRYARNKAEAIRDGKYAH